jgi:hypothetical protein
VNPSKSRKVNGYVKAVRYQDALLARLAARLELLRPLQDKVALARVEVNERRQALTGGQLGEAARMLAAEVGS